MYFLLLSLIFTVVLQSSLSVYHPGDPLPTDRYKSKTHTPGGSFKSIDIDDPNDDIIPPPESLTNSIHPLDHTEIPIDNVILSSTKSTPIPVTRNDQISSTLPPEKATKIKNLIKIGRWKYINEKLNHTRYWYEPEGGHMGTGWVFDGVTFLAYSKQEPDTEPVYAFHSEVRGIWTNTIQMDPQPPLIGNDQWISDGASFYAYKTPMNSTKLQPIWRYWNNLKSGETDATETRITYLTMNKDKNEENPLEWTLDKKILFYALSFEG